MAEYMGYILFILLPDEHQNYNRLCLRSGNGPQWESTSAQGSIVTSGRPSSYGLWLIPPIYGTLRQYDHGQRRSLCRGKNNYHTITGTMPSIQMLTQLLYDYGHDGLYADANTTIKHPPSRCPIFRCKHNYHTITLNDALYADVNTSTIWLRSRRPLCRCKHNYQAHAVTTASIQM